ncbi:MAG: recombination regulator RecX [Methylococcales bacterium]|nr:recombination regulator RecX [Methylococcales bacterium]
MRRKLRSRGFSGADIDPVLEQLQSTGLLNAVRFTEQYIEARAAKGFGPVRIAAELRERGIDRGLVDEMLDRWSGDWQVVVYKIWRKKYSGDPRRDFREREKRTRYLVQRGFTAEQIRVCMAVGDAEEFQARS